MGGRQNMCSSFNAGRSPTVTKLTGTTNAANIVIAAAGQVEVDHERNLCNVDWVCKRHNNHTNGAAAELPHVFVTKLVRVRNTAAHARYLIEKPIDFKAVARVNNGGMGVNGVFQAVQRVELALVALRNTIELHHILQKTKSDGEVMQRCNHNSTAALLPATAAGTVHQCAQSLVRA